MTVRMLCFGTESKRPSLSFPRTACFDDTLLEALQDGPIINMGKRDELRRFTAKSPSPQNSKGEHSRLGPATEALSYPASHVVRRCFLVQHSKIDRFR